MIDKTGVVLDPKELGRVKLVNPVKYIDAQGKESPVEKSYESYLGDLKKVQGDLNTTLDDIAKLVEQQKDLTVRLNGVMEDGKLTKPGLYALMEMENQTQSRVKKETEEVRPHWAIELLEAQQLNKRRLRLQDRLNELDAALPKGRK